METHTRHELNLREEPVSAAADPLPNQADEASARPSELKVVSRQANPKHDQHPLMPKKAQAPERRSITRVLRPWASRLATWSLH